MQVENIRRAVERAVGQVLAKGEWTEECEGWDVEFRWTNGPNGTVATVVVYEDDGTENTHSFCVRVESL